MHMALRTRRWTRADLDRLPDDGNRYEVLEGVLLVTPAPSPAHQQIIAWLVGRLAPFVVSHQLGSVHTPRSVMVNEGSQLEPDIMVLPAGRFETWEAAPTPILVVEVLSASTRRRDMDEKRRFYMERGVDEYWAVDRQTRAIIRIRRTGAEAFRERLTWSPAGGAASLEIDVAAMFREITGKVSS
jgi:Uma2 family endonuclease